MNVNVQAGNPLDNRHVIGTVAYPVGFSEVILVIYDLICNTGHEFEGWFKNPDDLQEQQASGILICPYCDSDSVMKKIAAPKVGKKTNSNVLAPSGNMVVNGDGAAAAYEHLRNMLGEVHEFIDNNFENVGNRFTDEAISIHRGEKEASNIRGTASKEQLKALAEEGVATTPIPPKPVDRKKLN